MTRLHVQVLANYVIPMIILFSVFCKDVGNLYKWLTFQPEGLYQRQILHAYNNIIIIHDINRVYINISGSVCSIIIYGWGFVQLERRAKQMD